MTTPTETIRELNDALRKTLTGGHAVLTIGVASLGAERVSNIVNAIAAFDDFCHANDPHEEHDFGALDVDGENIFFKVDYFDLSGEFASPDPANPAVTRRVITLMLASEY